VLIGVRERRRAGIRQTRATLIAARHAVDAYMARSDGGCPAELGAVTEFGAFEAPPRDAWGRPLRLTCPGRFEEAAYELSSDGPDGKPGGLDRIE
jgi:general secretion pathway protein G